jgi:hypothetical protein
LGGDNYRTLLYPDKVCSITACYIEESKANGNAVKAQQAAEKRRFELVRLLFGVLLHFRELCWVHIVSVRGRVLRRESALQPFRRWNAARGDAALLMLEQVPGTKRVTAGADKGYDTAEFVAECRHLGVTPHVAQNTRRQGGSAIDARTARHPGYAVSQRRRKRIEECFAWN